jgi:EpsI family protein
MADSKPGFLKSKATRILTAVLLLQATVFYGMSRKEVIPTNRPLNEVPEQFGNWLMVQEGVVEKEVQDVLRADEVLTRTYARQDANPTVASLFVAYFRTQRTGQAPHSPKNCLPGNGFVPTTNDTIKVPIDGRDPIEVNRYVVARGESKSMVLYWYQSRDRVVASEYTAKFYVVADAMRYNRTDTALVRIVVPVVGNDEAGATAAATEFIQRFFNPLRQHFPA